MREREGMGKSERMKQNERDRNREVKKRNWSEVSNEKSKKLVCTQFIYNA